MTYNKRITFALLFSLLVHVVSVAVWTQWPAERGVPARAPKPEPLVVTLNPQPPQPIRRLVESAAPAERPLEQTDLISDQDTQAQDESERTGERPQPAAERTAEFEDIASPPPAQPAAPTPPTTVARAVPPRPAEEREPPQEETPEPARTETERPPAPPPQQPREPRPEALPILEPVEPAPRKETPDEPAEARQPSEDELPEPFELAQASPPAVTAEPAPPSLSQPNEGASVARDNSGIVDRGAFSFEAHQHELGPYLLEVRRKVERRWRANMRLRYSGSGPADAVLECSISPDGRVVDVKILDPGRSATFAFLCKQALEQAAPFSAFPFDVPDVYTDENLVIRWKFSFL